MRGLCWRPTGNEEDVGQNKAAQQFERLFRGPGGAPAAPSPACGTRDCDRMPLRGSEFCGSCLRAEREGLIVVINGALDRRAAAAEQKRPPASGIQAGGNWAGR